MRELAFTNKLHSVFLQEGAKPVLALDFMLQVAFTSQPEIGSDRVTSDEAAAAYCDIHPWEFPAIRQHIRDTVEQSLDREDRIVLAVSNEFTILQRFFRLAFLGRFGDDFPVAKLDALAAELEKSAKPEDWTTPRWTLQRDTLEARASRILQNAAAAEKAGGSANPLKPEMEACAALAVRNDDRRKAFGEKLDKLFRIRKPADQTWLRKWAAMWENEDAAQVAWEVEWNTAANRLATAAKNHSPLTDENKEIVEAIERTTTAFKVRRALEVSKDERLGYEAQIGLRKPPVL